MTFPIASKRAYLHTHSFIGNTSYHHRRKKGGKEQLPQGKTFGGKPDRSCDFFFFAFDRLSHTTTCISMTFPSRTGQVSSAINIDSYHLSSSLWGGTIRQWKSSEYIYAPLYPLVIWEIFHRVVIIGDGYFLSFFLFLWKLNMLLFSLVSHLDSLYI